MPEDTPPGRVGRFEIRRELGRGTMGVVFEAHDPTLHRTVALKVIRLAFAASAKEKGDFERRFLVEARAAASLSHPGIVVVHEAGRDAESGMLYLALEHLEGRALSELIAEKGRFEEGAALRLAAQVARALDYAHRRGVVHRDVKPANVMVLSDGQAKILDFGLAKLDAGHEQTAAGQFLGTPLFVSPEQALGLTVDGRSDLFSLGAILYTLLAGRRPFEGETLARILNRVAHQPPRPLREANPAVSPATEAIVMRALEKDARERHSTGAAMAEDLEDALAGRSPRHAGRPGAAAAGGARPPDGESSAEAEGTVVALRAAGAGADEQCLPELALDEAHPQAPRASPERRRRRGPLRALSLTLLLGGLAFYYTAISGPERLAEALTPFLTDPARPLGLPGMRARLAPEAPSSPEPSEVPASANAMPSDPMHDPPSERSASPSPPAEAAGMSDPTPKGSEAAGASAVSADDSARTAASEPSHETPGEPAPDGDAEPETPVLLPDEGVEAAPAAADAPDSQAAAPEAAPTGKPQASSPPSAAPLPPPSVPPRSSSRPAAPPRAQLAIHLEHPLTRGTVRVWLDDKLILREPLSSTVSKKILFFAFRSGRVRETLEIPPGKHRLRVEVRGKDRADSAQTTTDFKPRVRRRLYVRPGASRGRLVFEWR